MKISRSTRFIGFLINTLSNILIIGLIINIILFFLKNTTIGGLMMGYKHKFSNPIIGHFIYLVSLIFINILYIITISILWVVDIVKMEKNKGTWAEKFAGCEKVKL